MDLHLVGGFLGSGKTTAIIQAARFLTACGQRVGIITNEQGKHLVDTEFIQLEGLTAAEVTGGCICCHLDDFEERIEEIAKEFDPQVLFAESVGSCTDLVATVIKPLTNFHSTSAQPASLSVFTDSRLLLRYLRDQDMPFSEQIVYIFEKQIEETGLLVINKKDLLSPEDEEEIVRLAQMRFPDKLIRLQNSLDEKAIKEWLLLIQSQEMELPTESLALNYDTYAAGEGKFAWLDRELEMEFTNPDSGENVSRLIEEISDMVSGTELQIAHLKFLVKTAGLPIKINLTGMDESGVGDQLTELKLVNHKQIQLLINAMVIGDAAVLETRLNEVIDRFMKKNKIKFKEIKRFNRVPGYPKPSMRIDN